MATAHPDGHSGDAHEPAPDAKQARKTWKQEQAELDKANRKRRKREQKRLDAARRRPDPWERYRILADVVDAGRRLIDLADHKARFALVIMGFLNALLVFIGTRSLVADAIPESVWPHGAAVLVPYVVVVLGFLAYAVECLRPRSVLDPRPGVSDPPSSARGVLYWEHILRHPPEDLHQTWEEIQMDQIDRELVLLSYGQAKINEAKYAALRRLYLCLHVMIALAAVLLAVAAWCVVRALGLLG